ncbi:MAG: calcium/sodium antiporter [Cyanobacteria bacterium J06639_1]
MAFFWLVVGFVLLVGGGESLVRGATGLARKLSIPPLIVGMTVVAFGTSAPEMVVSILAGLQGNDDLAVANVVGSNIFNTLMALGIPAIVAPIKIAASVIARELPILVGLSLAVFGMAATGMQIGRLEAGVLFVSLLIFITYNALSSRDESEEVQLEFEHVGDEETVWLLPFLLLVGGGALAVGARLVVHGAVAIANSFSISPVIIGLTIVAIGTSLPELMTSVVAAYKGEGDIATGNALGSCVFNLLGVLGVAGLIKPLQVSSEMLRCDLPWMVLTVLLIFPLVFSQRKITRLEGILMVGLYVLYMAWLVMRAKMLLHG